MQTSYARRALQSFSVSIPTATFVLAFAVRLVALLPPFVALNPYNKADALRFQDAAVSAAATFASGHLPIIPSVGDVYAIWGIILSPAYLLPGPHWLYAHVGVALIGAAGVTFVTRIVKAWTAPHTVWAVVLTALPLIFYPSIVFVHTALIRDVGIFFSYTAAARVLIVRDFRISVRAVLATFSLGFGLILRPELAPLVAAVVVIGIGGWLGARHNRAAIAGITSSAIVGIVGSISAVALSEYLVSRFAELRENRARGRSVYMADAVPHSLIDLVGIAIVGVVYLYFAPFELTQLQDYAAAIESLINFVFFVGLPVGIWRTIRRAPVSGIPLATAFIGGSLLLGASEVNVGTAMRHRQMILWILFAFGAVGLCSLRKRLGESR